METNDVIEKVKDAIEYTLLFSPDDDEYDVIEHLVPVLKLALYEIEFLSQANDILRDALSYIYASNNTKYMRHKAAEVLGIED